MQAFDSRCLAQRRETGRVTGWRLGLLLLSILGLGIASPSSGQIQWLNSEDGDILNVSSAGGLAPGYFTVRANRALEESADRGKILSHRFIFQYGLSPHLTFGGSAIHLQQRKGDLFKDGLGDSNLFFKAHFRPWKNRSVYLGLRQSLTLPTGYELERQGLVKFTSRKNDYSAQLLLSYRKQGIEAHINPGVIVPGGDAASFLTAGAGLSLMEFLPLGLNIQGEYYTRWDMVAEEFQTDVFFSVDRHLFWGLAMEGGVKRRLLQNEEVQPEWRIGLSLGRAHATHADIYEVRRPPRLPVNLLLLPVESLVPDPAGVRGMVTAKFRGAVPKRTPTHLLYFDTVTSDRLPAMRHQNRYQLRIRLLEIEEGRVTGLKIPMLLKAPRAETSIVAQMELIGPGGIPAARIGIFRGDASRGLGAELVPTTTSLETLVVPDEIKGDLRRRAVDDLAQHILDATAELIDERDAP